MLCNESIKPNFLNRDDLKVMLYLKIYTITVINNFPATQRNSDLTFSLQMDHN